MLEIIQSDVFKAWWEGLRDEKAQFSIDARLRRMKDGNLGDFKPVGEGVIEARINVGPGYRLYFIRSGLKVIVLLCGGNKSSQAKDIARAKKFAMEWN